MCKLYNNHNRERKTFLLTADTSRINKYYSCSNQLASRTQMADVFLCSLQHVPTIQNTTIGKANLILPKGKSSLQECRHIKSQFPKPTEGMRSIKSFYLPCQVRNTNVHT